MKSIIQPIYLRYGVLISLACLLTACTSVAVVPATESPLPPAPTTAPTTPLTPVPSVPSASPSSTETIQQLPGWTAYRNETDGFSLELPPGVQVTAEQKNYTRVDLPMKGSTNLAEKYLEITVLEGVSSCSSPLTQGYEPGAIPKEPVEINGIEFARERGSEGAAGNFYDYVAYSTEKGEACISLGFVLHSTNADNYENPPPTYETPAEEAVFEQIINTFHLDE
jgi:hypothetical protein